MDILNFCYVYWYDDLFYILNTFCTSLVFSTEDVFTFVYLHKYIYNKLRHLSCTQGWSANWNEFISFVIRCVKGQYDMVYMTVSL